MHNLEHKAKFDEYLLQVISEAEARGRAQALAGLREELAEIASKASDLSQRIADHSVADPSPVQLGSNGKTRVHRNPRVKKGLTEKMIKRALSVRMMTVQQIIAFASSHDTRLTPSGVHSCLARMSHKDAVSETDGGVWRLEAPSND